MLLIHLPSLSFLPFLPFEHYSHSLARTDIRALEPGPAMIPQEWRFWSPEGALTPGGPHTWLVIDWDQRRWYRVTGPAETLPDEEDAIYYLKRYVDHLRSDVYSLKLSVNGELIETSSYDPTYEIRYPPYAGAIDKRNTEVVHKKDLHEVERWGVGADLVTYDAGNNTKKLVAFKYTIIQQRVDNIWDELHILKALKGHDSFVSFDRTVIDNHKIVGFTSEYISGGTLEHYHDKPFYFRWLKQLTDAVDELNLRFGLMHQDIAPRNVLVDLVSGNLKVFDFDRAELIGEEKHQLTQFCNDVDAVVFTVYETLTKDEHFRELSLDQQDVREVERLKYWNLKLPLEEGKGGITAYRNAVAEWATERRTIRTIKHYTEASEPLSLPPYTKPPNFMMELPGGPPFLAYRRRRSEAYAVGDYVTVWERPPEKHAHMAQNGN